MERLGGEPTDNVQRNEIFPRNQNRSSLKKSFNPGQSKPTAKDKHLVKGGPRKSRRAIGL